MKRILVLTVSLLVLFSMSVFGATTITIWEKYDGQTQDPFFYQLVEEFNNSQDKYVVEMLHYGTEELRENFQNSMMAGEGPDAVISPFDHVGTFAVLGLAEPLDEILPTYIETMLVDNALPAMSLDGVSYGVPIDMGNHLMLLYNKDYVDKAPETWEELIEFGKEFTKDIDGDGLTDQYGLVYNLNEPFWFIPFLSGFGGWVMDEDRMPTLNTDATVKAFEFVQDLKFEHKIVPEECDYDTADGIFKEGKAAFLINGDWSLSGYVDVMGDKVGTAALPKFKDYEWPKPMMSGNGLIMAAGLSKEEKDGVFALLKYLLSEENQIKMVEKLNILPSTKLARAHDYSNNPIIMGSIEQLNHTKPMPIVPEMRGIWDGIRPALQDVMTGKMTPEEAAEYAQELSIENVEAMH